MTGHRGWRELAIIGDRLTSHDILEEGAIWSPIRDPDNWTEEVLKSILNNHFPS